MAGKTIYVGNLPGDVRRSEVEDLFGKYGTIREIDLKLPPRPPGFAFIEYKHSRDAEDAVEGRDNYDFDGNRLRVEIAMGGGRRGGGPPPMFGGMPPPMMGRGFGGGRGGGISRRTGYRVQVTGLPKSASWQDLKDHMRRAGDVTFAQVFSDRYGMMGVVDYSSKDDMKYALRKLDDSEFRNPFERCYIRVREDRDAERSRSRSRSRGRRSRSRSYSSRSRSTSSWSRSYSSRSRSRSVSSRSRSRSRSKSASKSPAASPAKSKSRSRSASPAADGVASPKPADD